MKIPSFFMGKIIVTLFPFIDIPSKNETFGSNTIRSATVSWLGSIPLKSAENAVFLRFLQGWVQMNPLMNSVGSNAEGKLNCINAVVITHIKTPLKSEPLSSESMVFLL